MRLLLIATAFVALAADPALVKLEAEMKRVAAVEAELWALRGDPRRILPDGKFEFHGCVPHGEHVQGADRGELLARVDQGKEKLDRMISLDAADLHPGSGTLSDLFNKPGVALGVNPLELMLPISDNPRPPISCYAKGARCGEPTIAADRDLGIRVDRPTSLLISDFVGVNAMNGRWSPEELRAVQGA
ncbi:MAG: hypothetical protein U0Q16_38460 [Bryobacteraceae bacterium]